MVYIVLTMFGVVLLFGLGDLGGVLLIVLGIGVVFYYVCCICCFVLLCLLLVALV